MSRIRKKLDLQERLKKVSEGIFREREGPLLKARRLREKLREAEGEGETEAPGKLVLPEYEGGAKRGIREFEIPPTLTDLVSLDLSYDKAGTEKLTQILTLKEDPEVQIKWTVTRDPYAEELALVVKEGMEQIKTHPPVFAAEFDEAVLICSHVGGYTFLFGIVGAGMNRGLQIFHRVLDSLERLF
jgi:hypothetical protein